MNKIRTISLSLSLVLLVSVLLPCFLVTPAVAQADPIKIGVFGPFTGGGLDFYAPWTQQGFELGLIYATTEMGYDNENMTSAGRPYEITYYDTQHSVTTAATLAVQAIETDGIDILVGGTYSNVAAAIAPIAEEYQKLFFISPAADATLTAENFNPYIFRIARNNWHDAYAGVEYAMDPDGLNHSTFAFIAADYSFGYSGVNSMKTVIEAKGGSVVSIQYASLFVPPVWDPYMTNLLTADAVFGIDYLFVIWAGDFAPMYDAFATFNIASAMDIAGACIDIKTMNEIEAGFVPPATYTGATGLCVYGYDLPNNAVNDWMVAQHVARNIKPNGALGFDYRVPELFTASGFATAQFLVDVTNAIPDLNSGLMINYLEGGIDIITPKGPTYLRPDDHQGLSEMYIATAVNDTRSGSETENYIIAELVETLDRDVVAPPIASGYPPGGFAPTPTPTGTTTPTPTPTTTPPPFDLLTIGVIGGLGVVIIVLIVLLFRKK